MQSSWRLRVGLDDRPGSIAAVTAKLAADGIDILRLDVVSRDGVAVDDIWVDVPGHISPRQLQELDKIPGVLFLNLSPAYGAEDPVSVMAAACAAAARAATAEGACREGVAGACAIGQAQRAALVTPEGKGALSVQAASGEFPSQVGAHEPCLARTAAETGHAVTALGTDHWAPRSWTRSLTASSVVAVPLLAPEGTCFSALLVVRDDGPAFQPGELARLTQYAQVLAGILRAHGAGSARETACWNPAAPTAVAM